MFALNSSNSIILFVIVGFLFLVAIIVAQAVIISMLNYQSNPIQDRLFQLKNQEKLSAMANRNDPFTITMNFLNRLAKPISKALYTNPHSAAIRQLLAEAGLPDTDKQLEFYTLQRALFGVVAAIIGGFLGAAAVVMLKGVFVYILCGILGGYVIGSMIPQILLRVKSGKRKAEIAFTLPDTLDLMVVCVEAGLGLDSTFQRTADEIKSMAPDMAQELKRLNKELNAGINRIQAFQNLGKRSGVKELRGLCAMVIQADKMGTSVAETLRIYSQDLRRKRKQKAEELASKASVKMIFPLVFFIFPPLFIVLLAPTVIQALATFKQ